jgi:acetyl esterase
MKTVTALLIATSLHAQLAPAPKGPMEYTRQPDLQNVSYGPHERHVFDLWKAKSNRPTPILVYFHPGGFNHGDKTWIEWLDKPLLELCLKRGISVATANYRYCDRQLHLPAPMLDGARAIQFLRLHAKEWNLDPQAVVAAGGSSGAGISLWIGFHEDLADAASADPVQRQSTRIRAIGSVDGQASYDPWVIAKLIDEKILQSPIIPALFGIKGDDMKTQQAHDAFAAGSPITYLKSDASPAFLYYTQNIKPLPPANQSEMIHNPRFGLLLKERMDKLGVECVFRTPKDYSSGETRPFTAGMVDFFIKHFPPTAVGRTPWSAANPLVGLLGGRPSHDWNR